MYRGSSECSTRPTDEEVAAAWREVDLLWCVYAAPDRDTAHRRLVVFYEWAVEMQIRQVTRLATTIDTWQDEVLAFFDAGATNDATESASVNIQDVRRAARGIVQPRQPEFRSWW